jgi:hypothetical protein
MSLRPRCAGTRAVPPLGDSFRRVITRFGNGGLEVYVSGDGGRWERYLGWLVATSLERLGYVIPPAGGASGAVTPDGPRPHERH